MKLRRNDKFLPNINFDIFMTK